MKKVEEYFKHATQCRDMARTAQPQHRQQLEAMAATWEQLASDRKAQLERTQRIAQLEQEEAKAANGDK
jgi:hypothetical protein